MQARNAISNNVIFTKHIHSLNSEVVYCRQPKQILKPGHNNRVLGRALIDLMKILQAALQALPVWPAKSQEQGVPIALIVSVSYQIRGYTSVEYKDNT